VNRERGATMVEFALVSVVAFALIFGMAGLGLLVFGDSIGSNAARDGARVALINYVDADIPGSANNLAVVSAVKRRLVGLDTFQSVTVVCRPADDLTATEPCESTSVDFDRSDVIEVAVTWRAGGVPPFGGSAHSATARMVIGGAPDLSPSPTSPTTTTTGGSTTTTTAPATTQTEIAAQMADNDHDGRIDQVLVTFSGALDPSCASGWTLANVPSGGSLAAVTISGSTATLAITEGAGAPDTAVNSFTVAFAGCSGAAAFGPLAPSDAAGPVFVSMSDSAGATDGKPEPGDTLSLLFSEPLSPSWGSSTTTTVTMARSGNQNATISIPSLVSGNLFDSGSSGYVAKNQTVTFNDSTLSASGATLRLTLGSACTGCTHTGVGQGSFTFTPSGSIRDAGGYVSIAPIIETNLKLF